MKTAITLVCIALIFTSCKKSKIGPAIYSSQGTIIGFDYRACQLCGGLKISIKNDPTPTPPPFYLINSSLSAPINIGPDPHFPVNVALDWKPDTAIHAGNFIIITRIKVLN